MGTPGFAPESKEEAVKQCCRRRRSEPPRRPAIAPLDQPRRPASMLGGEPPMRLMGSSAQVPKVAHFGVGTNNQRCHFLVAAVAGQG